jgi:hypothetical protein
MRIRGHITRLAAVVLFSGQALAQTPSTKPVSAAAGSASNQWSFSFIFDGYVVPHSEFLISPMFTGDREWLHLEARYNYEDRHTGSLWAGYNFSVGHKLTLEATPMIGGIFGNTTGIAPGYEVSLSYKKVSLSSSGEYVFDTKERGGSFFYSWPQLTYSPSGWLRVGLVAQRTKAYHTNLDVQRGLLVGLSHKNVQFTTYVFNLGWTDPTWVFEAGFDF